MDTLKDFKNFLENELNKCYYRPNTVASKVLKPDLHRINEIQTVMRILGEYEHFVVNRIQ